MSKRVSRCQANSQQSQNRKKIRAVESDLDNDNDVTTQFSTQASTSTQATAGDNATLNNKQLERLVSDLVRYLLIANQKKYPVKRPDIMKHVVKEYSRSCGKILEGAKSKLLKVFAINLVEVGERKGTYLLINTINPDAENLHLAWSNAENAHMGLLIAVLSIVFMNGDSIPANELFQALKKLGLDSEAPHGEFGDVTKLLTKEFVRQMYLEYQRVPNSDPVAWVFSWGPRAHHEVSKKDVLDFVCQVYGDIKPDQWKTQYEDATRED